MVTYMWPRRLMMLRCGGAGADDDNRGLIADYLGGRSQFGYGSGDLLPGDPVHNKEHYHFPEEPKACSPHRHDIDLERLIGEDTLAGGFYACNCATAFLSLHVAAMVAAASPWCWMLIFVAFRSLTKQLRSQTTAA